MKASGVQFVSVIKIEVQFKIPIYQRLYDWRKEHCLTLMEDIERLLRNPKIPIHFMGSIVYIDEKGYTNLSGTKEVLVIDGQQRLTTFSLICLILEKLAKNDKDLIRKIRNNMLINEYSNLENKNKIILNKKDNEIYEKLVNGEEINDNQSNLIKNYKFLKSKLEELNKEFTVNQIFEILNKLMIVDVCLFHDQDNPQQIFESLNATGKALTDGDLIRNFLLMNLKKDVQNHIYTNYWYPIENILNDELTDFLEDYIYMKKGTSTNIKDLYKSFKDYFYKNYSHEKVEKIAEDLLRFAKYYTIISNEKDENNDINETLNRLNNLDIYSHYPLLMRIYDKYNQEHINSEDIIEILNIIESFLFRRSICNIPTNSLNPVFRTMWTKLDKKNIKKSLVLELKSGEWNKKWPNNEEFHEQLIDANLYTHKFDKVLLEELEKYDNKEANKDFSSLSIEHILPQTNGDAEKLSKEWKKMLGPNYKEIRDKWVHKLGNLTLTGYNPEYSARSFDEKKNMRNGYKESSLRLNNKIAEYPAWNENSIKDRAKKLAQIAIKRWSFF